MKISTRTRYGMRLMVELGIYYDKGSIFLKDIAKAEDISEKYLSQIIIPLRAAGLVNSFRGARGGYALAKPPKQITLGEIVAVLEGDLELVNCVNNPLECSRVSVCATRDLWGNLAKKIVTMLNGMSLGDLVEQCRQKRKDSLMYNI